MYRGPRKVEGLPVSSNVTDSRVAQVVTVRISIVPPGSVGQSADPAKVYKNKKLPGQYGNKKVTVQNLEVVTVDADKNLLMIRGNVPGAKGGLITVSKSLKGAR